VSASNARVVRPALFTRKATGLVREGRTTDALFYNVMWSSVALTFAFYWLFFALYPGSNPFISFLVAAVLGTPGAFLYAMLTQVMPRTGGDYVFNSRALHPALGFAGNFSYCFWLAVVIGVYTTYFAAYGGGAFCRMLAGFTGATFWLDVGAWFASPWGLFLTGTLVLLLSAAIFALGGIRLFFRVQALVFLLYVVGAVALPIVVGVIQSHTGFLHNFDSYAANLGTRNAAGALDRAAAKAGYQPSGFDLTTSFRSASVFWFIFGFIFSTTYFAGEIRLQRRTHLKSMPGAVLVVVLMLLVLTAAYVHTIGYDFSAKLGTAAPAAYGFGAGAPAYPELMAIAVGNPVVGAVIIVGFSLGLLIWLPQTLLLVSRSMFAWSFDRVVPERISYVEPRSRSPLVAIAIMTAVSIGSTAVYSFTTWFSSLSALLGLSLTLLVTAVGGMLLPYRQRAMVDASPYNRRLAGIPSLTVVGALALIGFGAAVGILLWDPGSGASLSHDPGKLILAVVVFALAVGIYFLARSIRRGQGIELDLAYRELPPE
jgi:basic amino acid/polyamine antiporter, APA family